VRDFRFFGRGLSGVGLRRTPRFSTTLAVALLAALGFASTGIRPAAAITCAPLVPSDDEYTTGFGQTLKVNRPGLLANDTGTSMLVEVSWGFEATNPDPSDDTSLYGNADIRYGDPTGALNRQGGFRYTPDPDPSAPFSGIDEFTYWIIDSCGNDDLATAYVTVVPTVVNSNYATPLNTTLDVPVESGFLANDEGFEPTSLFFDMTSAHGGSIDDSGAQNGSFEYTPPPGFSGMDSFGYQVDDLNFDNTYSGTVYIQVGGPTAPATVIATGDDHQAYVSFSSAAPNGSPITSYTATASPGGQTTTGSGSPLLVTGLTNGTSYRFSVHATNGSGVGAESALSNAVVPDDGLPPVVAMSTPTATVTLATNVSASWHASDDTGILRYDARRSAAAWNGSRGAWTGWNAGLATNTTYAGTYARTYCFEARALDKAANVSGWTAPRCTAVPLRSDQLVYTSSWARASNAAAFAGLQYASKSHGATMTRTGIVAKQVFLVLAKCASCGTVQVRLNGVVIANVNTYSPSTLHKQVVRVGNWASAHSGTLTATVTSATGKTVAIEGLAVYNG
jgi:Bacterial Ig domain/Fibronectin type III domain